MVSAWASDNGITLGQLAVNEKSNEITAIPELLDIIDVRGAVITIDTMGCRTSIAAKRLSSLLPNARRISRIIRCHWSIENQLHWVLDVVFEEDAAPARKDNSPLNMNILRKTALSLLLPVKQGTQALKN